MRLKIFCVFTGLAIVSSVWLLLNQAPVSGQASLGNSSFFTPDSNPYGKSYEEWARNWWQWHISLPASANPKNVSVTTCPVLNNGQVSFIDHRLVGKYEFTCNIPTGNAVMTTILSGECDSDEKGTMEEKPILQCAKEGGDLSTTAITLDNVSLKDNQSRITTKFFNITIPEDNVYEANPGTFKGVVDGYFLFLKPLSKGEHDLNIKVGVNNPSDPNFTNGYDAKLKLLVD